MFCSTIARLECSLSEGQKAYDELKATADKDRTQALDCEAQVTGLTSELESLRQNLHIRVVLFVSFDVSSVSANLLKYTLMILMLI